jgi:hypothetical protein
MKALFKSALSLQFYDIIFNIQLFIYLYKPII